MTSISRRSEREAIKNVKQLREQESERVESKDRKHQAHLRKQMLDGIQGDFVENMLEPLKEWSGNEGVLAH
jgi:hypothetical protein